MPLTDKQKEEFARHGILKLNQVIEPQATSRARDSVSSELDRLQIASAKSAHAAKLRALPVFQQTTRLAEMVKLNRPIAELFSENFLANIEALLGTKRRTIFPQPQLLLSLPQKEDWTLNNLNWHLDAKIPERDKVTGVQAFVLVDHVLPRGGATLAIAGSHRLPYENGIAKKNAHQVLRQSEKFAPLFDGKVAAEDSYFKPQIIADTEVFIVEMSGKAGDGYLMDMRILHTPSINATKKIRMMVTSRFFADSDSLRAVKQN